MGTGVAPHASPPVEWSNDKNIRWKIALSGKGHSTPVIRGDRKVTTKNPLAKLEILAPVQKLGWKTTSKKPSKLLDTLLYGQNPKFKNWNGKFSPAWPLVRLPRAALRRFYSHPLRAAGRPQRHPAFLALSAHDTNGALRRWDWPQTNREHESSNTFCETRERRFADNC